MKVPIPTAVALAAIALAGCGEEEEPAVDVKSYLPGESSILSAVDFEAAREQLDLPEDADALPFETLLAGDFDRESTDASLLNAAMIGVPLLSTSAQTLEADPVAEAFDGTRISAAATGSGEGGPVSAIATDQPFDELAKSLEAEGFEREGDVLTGPGERIREVADTGEGVVLISGEEGAAGDLASDPAGGPADLIELIEPADQPVAQAAAGLGEDCLSVFGGWENLAATDGVLRIALDQPAAADRLEEDGISEFARIDLGTPVVDGQTVEVPFTGEEGASGSAIRDLLVSFGTNLYRCR